MNKRIEEIIEENHIIVSFENNLEHKGYYISKLRMIVINSSLSEEEQFLVILHELGHALNNDESCKIYNSTYNNHSKEEWAANSFLIKELASEYSSYSNCDIKDVNFNALIKKLKLGFRCDEVKKLIESIN